MKNPRFSLKINRFSNFDFITQKQVRIKSTGYLLLVELNIIFLIFVQIFIQREHQKKY